MTPFARAVHRKGWTLRSLGERWGLCRRQMTNVAREPKRIHWDAVNGLPVKD